MPSVPRAGIVDEADPKAVRLDDVASGERLPKRRIVHVPVHGLDGPKGAQVLEDGGGREVADVEDEVGRAEEAQAGLRKPPRAARKVRVPENRDQARPSRKRPSR